MISSTYITESHNSVQNCKFEFKLEDTHQSTATYQNIRGLKTKNVYFYNQIHLLYVDIIALTEDMAIYGCELEQIIRR